jgi:hypothetical protein
MSSSRTTDQGSIGDKNAQCTHSVKSLLTEPNDKVDEFGTIIKFRFTWCGAGRIRTDAAKVPEARTRTKPAPLFVNRTQLVAETKRRRDRNRFEPHCEGETGNTATRLTFG